MNDPMKPPSGRPAPSRLERLVAGARLVIRVERLWPTLVLAAGIVAVFIVLSWLGAWVAAPRSIRIGGVVLLAAGLALAAILAVRGVAVSRRDALARLDRDSGQAHRPISAAEDRLANAGQDPLTQALWDLSRRRLEGTLARLRLRSPTPRLAARDPYALRAAALFALVAAGFVAGEGKDGLIAAAFDWRGAVPAGPGFRVDAWVDPPGYTGRPPVLLLGGSASPVPDQAVTVPIRSTVVVRSAGTGSVVPTLAGALKAAVPPVTGGQRPAETAPAGTEHKFTLDGNGQLTLTRDGTPLAHVTLTATPDLPPTIVLVEPPRPTARGGLTLGYRIDDDYGVTRAEAAFTDPTYAERPIVRSLVPPPKLDLNLPPTPGGLGTGQTTGDLSDHPWAGAEVTIVLSTGDEGGNVGLSAPVRMTLPARPFANPLARALVEQRRNLVFDPDHREGVGTALDALMIDPDRFGTSAAVYLGLRTARTRLSGARIDEDLVALADYLWQMALRVEEGDKSAAARDLQAAEQALREALKRGAAPDEIKRLTEALRQTMDKFLAEMAQRHPSAQDAQADPNARVVTPQQLQDMMRRMDELAQSGDTAEAQRMLDQLQAMLDNLRTARRSDGQAQREMNRQMGELDKMSRDQQALRDKTFRQGRKTPPGADDQPSADDGDDPDDSAQNGPRAQEQAPGEQPGGDDLAGQQGGLRERLDDLKRRMRQLGLKGEQGLEDAEQAMKDAEGALGQGKPGNRRAVEAQGRALQGLQQGASGLAQQMASQPGQSGQPQQQGEGEGTDGRSISQGSTGQEGDDPLGRAREGRGRMETRGRALGDSVAERAQRVLQELRRRLGDPNRSSEEMDYLERLLQHY